jgi:hypothetical protein
MLSAPRAGVGALADIRHGERTMDPDQRRRVLRLLGEIEAG